MLKKTVLLSLVAVAVSSLFSAVAMAADGAVNYYGELGLGVGIAMGLAVLGGALGQGKTASAALESTARNPGASKAMFMPMILGLVLIESLVIYALAASYFLVQRIPVPGAH